MTTLSLFEPHLLPVSLSRRVSVVLAKILYYLGCCELHNPAAAAFHFCTQPRGAVCRLQGQFGSCNNPRAHLSPLHVLLLMSRHLFTELMSIRAAKFYLRLRSRLPK